MIKGIIFDMDGTLIDTNDLVINCIQDTVEKFMGYHPEKESFVEILGKPLEDQMLYFDESHKKEMVNYYRKMYTQKRDQETKMFPDVMEMLINLKKMGIIMGVVSNKGRNGIDHVLKKFGLIDYFDITISASDVVNKKPHPEAVYKVLEKWQLASEEVIFVGDSDNDILIANNAGILSVLVDWTILPKRLFDGLKIDYIIKEPEELTKIII
ncbi:MAG: HAD-IA family hydrolase [Clostridiales bacterium]|nr:HAD-IA family hydrolase [Clostridiales bacterium]